MDAWSRTENTNTLTQNTEQNMVNFILDFTDILEKQMDGEK